MSTGTSSLCLLTQAANFKIRELCTRGAGGLAADNNNGRDGLIDPSLQTRSSGSEFTDKELGLGVYRPGARARSLQTRSSGSEFTDEGLGLREDEQLVRGYWLFHCTMQLLPLHLRSIEPGYLFSHNMSYFFLNSFIEISSTRHTIHPLKMYNSVVFRVFTATSNHLHSQFQSIFVTSERNVHSLGITAIAHPHPPPLSPGNHQSAVSIHVFASSGHFTKTNSYSK